MKNSFRIIAVLSAVFLIAVSLCSCQALDKMRDDQAFYQVSEREIVWHDQTYKILHTGKFHIISTRSKELHVTAPDVPVLLSGLEGIYATLERTDDTVISVYGNYYVRKDKYEAVQEVIESAVLDHYYLSFYPDSHNWYRSPDGNYDADYWNVSILNTIIMDQDVTDLINNAIEMSDSDKVLLNEDSLQSAKALLVSPCDKDMMVTDYDADQIVLLNVGEHYYIRKDVAWDDGYYACPVDEDGAKLIKALFEEHPEAVDQTAF